MGLCVQGDRFWGIIEANLVWVGVVGSEVTEFGMELVFFGGLRISPLDIEPIGGDSRWRGCRSDLFVYSAGVSGLITGKRVKSPDP